MPVSIFPLICNMLSTMVSTIQITITLQADAVVSFIYSFKFLQFIFSFIGLKSDSNTFWEPMEICALTGISCNIISNINIPQSKCNGENSLKKFHPSAILNLSLSNMYIKIATRKMTILPISLKKYIPLVLDIPACLFLHLWFTP